MSGVRYIRDTNNGSVLFVDPKAYKEFTEKRDLMEELRILRCEINTIREDLRTLQAQVQDQTTGR